MVSRVHGDKDMLKDKGIPYFCQIWRFLSTCNLVRVEQPKSQQHKPMIPPKTSGTTWDTDSHRRCTSNPLLEESAYPEETHHSVDRAIDTIARDQSQTWIAYESACKRYEVCYEKGTLPEILMLYEHWTDEDQTKRTDEQYAPLLEYENKIWSLGLMWSYVEGRKEGRKERSVWFQQYIEHIMFPSAKRTNREIQKRKSNQGSTNSVPTIL